MQNKPLPGLCSVICTTYNHSRYSAQSIQSIFDQTYRNIEIIIIDDGSRDGNVSIMQKKLEESPFPFTLIDQENTGKIGLNVNRALAAAKGEYVCPLSLDDLLLPDCIESKITLFERDKNMAVVANATYMKIDGTGRSIKNGPSAPVWATQPSTGADMLEHEFKEFGTYLTQGAVIRHSIIDAVGGYDEDLTGDDLIIRTKIWLYMVERPELAFALLQNPGFIYRKHDQNIHKDSFRQLRTIIEWRDRYFPARPLPELFTAWANHFFGECMVNGRHEELQRAIAYSPEISIRYRAFRRTWKYRRRTIKSFIKRSLGLLPK